MRLALTVVDPLGGGSADVVVDVEPQTSVGEVAREVERQVGVGGEGGAQIISLVPGRGGPRAPGTPAVYVDGYAVDPARPVAESPLREGAVVSLYDPAGCVPGEPAGVVELRVVGGPDAGAVHRLGVGRVEIGRGPAARIRVNDPEMAERAATLTVGMDGVCRVALGQESTDWALGTQIGVGNSLLELARYAPPNAALHPGDDGVTLDYNRPPRLLPPERTTRFRLPQPPGDPHSRPLPWLMALAPLAMSVMMSVMMGQAYYLLMAFVSPIVMIGNYFVDKKNGRTSHTRTVTEYRRRKARIEQDAQEALAAEQSDRLTAAPDPATVLNAATGPRTRLWERRRSDADHLVLRVGTATLPSEVVLDDPGAGGAPPPGGLGHRERPGHRVVAPAGRDRVRRPRRGRAGAGALGGRAGRRAAQPDGRDRLRADRSDR